MQFVRPFVLVPVHQNEVQYSSRKFKTYSKKRIVNSQNQYLNKPRELYLIVKY